MKSVNEWALMNSFFPIYPIFSLHLFAIRIILKYTLINPYKYYESDNTSKMRRTRQINLMSTDNNVDENQLLPLRYPKRQ